MRVNFNTPSSASRARIQLHQLHFGDTDINCYFAQPVTPIGKIKIKNHHFYLKKKKTIYHCNYF